MKAQEEELINSVQNLSINSQHPHKPITSTTSTKSTSISPSSLAGMDDVLEALREAIIWPHLYHQEGASLGISWPRGLLLHGPSGTGKSSAVAAVAKECNASIHTITAASIFGAYTGQSERRLREVFEAAQLEATNQSEDNSHPVIIFIDEIDALCPTRDSKKQHEARVVAQLLTLMDGANSGISSSSNKGGGHIPSSFSSHIVVIAATNRPNAIDPALRRAGRFDREVSVNIPLLPSRLAILERLIEKMPLADDVDLHCIAAKCHGYTGADLAALCREAAMRAINRNSVLNRNGASNDEIEEEEEEVVKMGDFMGAMSKVGPSIARGLAVDFIPIQWEDIGGLEDVKLKIKQAVEWPLKHADAFERLGLTAPRGVLLHGPPGCSKTTLARAAATASGATFVSLSGAQVYSMYLGEGEALLRETFKRARLSAPSIIFLDELDSIVGKREQSNSGSGSGLSESGSRILSTLLTEMDGLELAQGVLVMGATNRPTALDAALLRPGRFDIALFVPPPDHQGRIAALKVHSRKMPVGDDVDFEEMAKRTEMFTGAELAAVCREAALSALREDPGAARVVCARHFEDALRGSSPLLDEKLLEKYASWPGDR